MMDKMVLNLTTKLILITPKQLKHLFNTNHLPNLDTMLITLYIGLYGHDKLTVNMTD